MERVGVGWGGRILGGRAGVKMNYGRLGDPGSAK